jgi:cation diffusion facilitator family transporter
MVTQTAVSFADVAVEVFLMVGVVSSSRPPDISHPLGYGRERFFWSLLAAIGIFVGGCGVAGEEAAAALRHATPPGAYAVGYVVLIATVVLDRVTLVVALAPLRKQAADWRVSLRRLLRRSTDSAGTTVVVGNAAGVAGAAIAMVALASSQLSGNSVPDAVGSALIGVVLFVASVQLLRVNRDLLAGRGLPPAQLAEMRKVVAAQAGVVDVPDIFAVVVGPSSLIVNGDVTFDDDLDVPGVETAIARASDALRLRWPSIAFVYLNPVAGHRPRSSHSI